MSGKFWNTPSIELKTSFRWRVQFQGSDLNIPAWVCKKATKPSYTIKSTEHKYLGMHRFNFPTHLEWQPISLTLVDFYNTSIIDPDNYSIFAIDINSEPYRTPATIQSLINSISSFNSGYKRPNDAEVFKSILFKDNITDSISRNNSFLKLSELDSNGIAVETWNIKNPLITSVKFGELSYESDSPVEINLEIVYDWAELEILTFEKYKNQKTDSKKDKEENIKKEEEEKKIYFDEFVRRAQETSKKELSDQLSLAEFQQAQFALESFKRTLFVQSSPPFRESETGLSSMTKEELALFEDANAQSKIAKEYIKKYKENLEKDSDISKKNEKIISNNEEGKKKQLEEEKEERIFKAEQAKLAARARARKEAADLRAARQEAERQRKARIEDQERMNEAYPYELDEGDKKAIAQQSQSDILQQTFAGSPEERVAAEERQVAAEVATQRAAIEEYRKKQEAIQRAAAEAKAASQPVGRGGNVVIGDKNAPKIPAGSSAVIITSKGTTTLP